jgi:hypothetical protein
MLQCSFDALAQCQAMSSGRGGDCLRNLNRGGSDACAYPPSVRKTYAYAPHRQK